MGESFLLRTKFDGGIAASGSMHLYEYSRSQYATARFITVIEQFRGTGEVIDKVTAQRTIDIIVSAPSQGSFLETLWIPVATETAKAAAGVSFKSLFAYVWAKLLPPSEGREKLTETLAKIELARERERTRQSSQETERLKVLQAILRDQTAPLHQSLQLIDRALEAGDRRTLDAGYGPEQLINEREMIRADIRRDGVINDDVSAVSQIDSDKINRLVSKVRPMVDDMALPLRGSVERFMIGDAANDDAFIRLDRERLQRINPIYLDPNFIDVRCILRSYDKFTGRGKIEAPEFAKTMYFSVEYDRKSEMRDDVLNAMRLNRVTCRFSPYRDRFGTITSLILREVFLDGADS
jgi:hypothetical protein